MKNEKRPQGAKTHQQFRQTLEQKPDEQLGRKPDRNERQSEFPVSYRGMNQESEHNKHNHPQKGA